MKKPSFHQIGFTLVEMLVVITIIIVLAAILFPTISRLRDKAAATGCASNMRQCIVMGNMFAAENNGSLPRLQIQNSMMSSHTGKSPVLNRLHNVHGRSIKTFRGLPTAATGPPTQLAGRTSDRSPRLS